MRFPQTCRHQKAQLAFLHKVSKNVKKLEITLKKHGNLTDTEFQQTALP